MEQAETLLQTLSETGAVEFDAFTYAHLFDGCSNANNIRKGFELFADMKQRGIIPNANTFSSLIRMASFSRQRCVLDRAIEEVREQGQLHNVPLNIHVYRSMVNAWTAHKDLSLALKIVAECVQAKQLTNDAIYEDILPALAKHAARAKQGAALLGLISGIHSSHDFVAMLPPELKSVPLMRLRPTQNGKESHSVTCKLATSVLRRLHHHEPQLTQNLCLAFQEQLKMNLTKLEESFC